MAKTIAQGLDVGQFVGQRFDVGDHFFLAIAAQAKLSAASPNALLTVFLICGSSASCSNSSGSVITSCRRSSN